MGEGLNLDRDMPEFYADQRRETPQECKEPPPGQAVVFGIRPVTHPGGARRVREIEMIHGARLTFAARLANDPFL